VQVGEKRLGNRLLRRKKGAKMRGKLTLGLRVLGSIVLGAVAVGIIYGPGAFFLMGLLALLFSKYQLITADEQSRAMVLRIVAFISRIWDIVCALMGTAISILLIQRCIRIRSCRTLTWMAGTAIAGCCSAFFAGVAAITIGLQFVDPVAVQMRTQKGDSPTVMAIARGLDWAFIGLMGIAMYTALNFGVHVLSRRVAKPSRE